MKIYPVLAQPKCVWAHYQLKNEARWTNFNSDACKSIAGYQIFCLVALGDKTYCQFLILQRNRINSAKIISHLSENVFCFFSG